VTREANREVSVRKTKSERITLVENHYNELI